MGERALLIHNPAAGKRTAEDGDLVECVRLLLAAGFDIETRETGAEHPTSAELARSAVALDFTSVILARGGGPPAPPARGGPPNPGALGRPPLRGLLEVGQGVRCPPQPAETARPAGGGHVGWRARRSDLPEDGTARSPTLARRDLAAWAARNAAAAAARQSHRDLIQRADARARRRSDRGASPDHGALPRRRPARVRMSFRPMSIHVRTCIPIPESVPVTFPSRSATSSS